MSRSLCGFAQLGVLVTLIQSFPRPSSPPSPAPDQEVVVLTVVRTVNCRRRRPTSRGRPPRRGVTSQSVLASWVTRKVVGNPTTVAPKPRQMPMESTPAHGPRTPGGRRGPGSRCRPRWARRAAHVCVAVHTGEVTGSADVGVGRPMVRDAPGPRFPHAERPLELAVVVGRLVALLVPRRNRPTRSRSPNSWAQASAATVAHTLWMSARPTISLGNAIRKLPSASWRPKYRMQPS